MLTFNNNAELKSELLSKLKHHQELDTFIQGTWLTSEKVEGNGYKGCFYGCTMQTSENPIDKFSEKYQIDLWYCYLTEKLFENLPSGMYQKFPLESIDILPVGFDFNILKSKFHKAVLLKQLDWVEDAPVRECLVYTSKLFDVPYNEIDKEAAWSAWSAARSAAESAAGSAARSAARSARSAAESAESAESAGSAGSAAWSAAWSAGSAAESAESAESAGSAAGSAARSAARSAAKTNHYIWLKETLFSLIQECS